MITVEPIDSGAPRHPSSISGPLCGACRAPGDLVRFTFTATISVTLCAACVAVVHRLTAPPASEAKEQP